MGLVIGTNVASMKTVRALNKSSDEQSKSSVRIASGQRITSGSDDASGLSISEDMRSQIRSLGQAERNAHDAVSLVQVAEGSLSDMGSMMIRMRELAIQAATDTIGDHERKLIDKEYQSIVSEVNRLSKVTEFNGTKLLDGGSSKDKLEFQIGIRNTDDDHVGVDLSDFDMSASALGVSGASTISKSDARDSLEKVDEAIHKVTEARAHFGAMQSRIQSSTSNLAVARENMSQARSRIADTDMATETSELVKSKILQAAGIAVLAQANEAPAAAIKLL